MEGVPQLGELRLVNPLVPILVRLQYLILVYIISYILYYIHDTKNLVSVLVPLRKKRNNNFSARQDIPRKIIITPLKF